MAPGVSLLSACLCVAVCSVRASGGIDAALGRIFAGLTDQIEDSSCQLSYIDRFNNGQVFPRLNSLLARDFFRFFQVNLHRDCPFWSSNDRCSQSTCQVRCCSKDEVPSALKGQAVEDSGENDTDKMTGKGKDCDEDVLGKLDTTIAKSRREDLDLRAAQDSARGEFCDVGEDQDDQLEFVDLSLNPERYTGYKGETANRIWRAIYEDNCLKLNKKYDPLIPRQAQCLEERAFFKAVSGLHSSITVHLCAVSLISEECKGLTALAPSTSRWGPDTEEFAKRFDPDLTSNEGPGRLKNLYFIYLLELRAIHKASPLLKRMPFIEDDSKRTDTKEAVLDLLNTIDRFPCHFDETVLFKDLPEVKLEFSQNFYNISRIMDCVSCDKCKLWGKLQTKGLGTALKILFSGHFDNLEHQISDDPVSSVNTFLSRNEVVALLNAFGRISTSVRHLEVFKSVISNSHDKVLGHQEL